MARRLVSVPVGVEIIDPDDGSALAVAPTPSEGSTPPALRTWLSIAVVIVAIAGITVAVSDKDPNAPPPLGIFELLDVDVALAPPPGAAQFPLFGREWDESLLFFQREDLIEVDLNTGRTRVVGFVSPEQRGDEMVDLTVVDGVPHLAFISGWILRIRSTGSTRIQRMTGLRFGRTQFFGRDEATGEPGNPLLLYLVELTTGADIDDSTSTAVTTLGDHLFTQAGGLIVETDGSYEPREWARGEILDSGRDAIVWRFCKAPEDCSSWAGTIDNAKAMALDIATVESGLVADPLAHVATQGRVVVPRLSPDGRISWTIDPESAAAITPTARLVDLTNGSSIELHGISVPPIWAIDGSAFVTSNGDNPIVVDINTGEMIAIPLLQTTASQVLQPVFAFTD